MSLLVPSEHGFLPARARILSNLVAQRLLAMVHPSLGAQSQLHSLKDFAFPGPSGCC